MIKGLLEKLDPSTISLQVNSIGQIDTAAKEVREKEEREEFEKSLEKTRKKEKKAKKKMRGRNKIGNKMASQTRQMHEKEREKNKLAYLKDYEREQKERSIIEQDLEFLGKHERKFDPVEVVGKEGEKRQRLY
jgi:histidyl-tRNA synthetase